MATMKDVAILQDKEGKATKLIADFGVRVRVLGNEGSRTNIKLLEMEDPPQPEGWVSFDAVDVTDSPPNGPINKESFARACWRQALYFGLNPHYLAAIAEVQSQTMDGRAADRIGPYRLTQQEWDLAITDPEFRDDKGNPVFQSEDIMLWRRQCAVFASMTLRALEKEFANKVPTVIDLCAAQLTIPDSARAEVAKRIDAALAATRDAVEKAGKDVLDDPPNNSQTLKDSNDAAKVTSPKLTEGTFKEIAPRLMKRLINDFNLTDVQAAGILGNIGHECGGFKHMQEINPLGGGRGGLGMCQWTGPRRRQFEKFCSDKGFATNDEEGNYLFLKFELQNTEKTAIPAVKATNDLDSAMRRFEQTFERAGVKHYPARLEWAKKALAAFGGG